MTVLSLPTIAYKSKRIQEEWESGNVKIKLVKLVELCLRYISLECPKYNRIILTDVLRFQDEQDRIYLNHVDLKIRKKYQKKPWPSVHQYWRAVDIRTSDMPYGLSTKLTKFLNMITYDFKRPRKKTAILHDVGTGMHIHIQVMS